MRTLTVTYDKNNWPCPAVEQTLQALVEEGALPRMPEPACVISTSHNDLHSHIDGATTVEAKLGSCTARAIENELMGTEHEWMLDIQKQLPDNFDGGNFKGFQ